MLMTYVATQNRNNQQYAMAQEQSAPLPGTTTHDPKSIPSSFGSNHAEDCVSQRLSVNVRGTYSTTQQRSFQASQHQPSNILVQQQPHYYQHPSLQNENQAALNLRSAVLPAGRNNFNSKTKTNLSCFSQSNAAFDQREQLYGCGGRKIMMANQQQEPEQNPLSSSSKSRTYASKLCQMAGHHNSSNNVRDVDEDQPLFNSNQLLARANQNAIDSRREGQHKSPTQQSHLTQKSHHAPLFANLGLAQVAVGVGVGINLPHNTKSKHQSVDVDSTSLLLRCRSHSNPHQPHSATDSFEGNKLQLEVRQKACNREAPSESLIGHRLLYARRTSGRRTLQVQSDSNRPKRSSSVDEAIFGSQITQQVFERSDDLIFLNSVPQPHKIQIPDLDRSPTKNHRLVIGQSPYEEQKPQQNSQLESVETIKQQDLYAQNQMNQLHQSSQIAAQIYYQYPLAGHLNLNAPKLTNQASFGGISTDLNNQLTASQSIYTGQQTYMNQMFRRPDPQIQNNLYDLKRAPAPYTSAIQQQFGAKRKRTSRDQRRSSNRRKNSRSKSNGGLSQNPFHHGNQNPSSNPQKLKQRQSSASPDPTLLSMVTTTANLSTLNNLPPSEMKRTKLVGGRNSSFVAAQDSQKNSYPFNTLVANFGKMHHLCGKRARVLQPTIDSPAEEIQALKDTPSLTNQNLGLPVMPRLVRQDSSDVASELRSISDHHENPNQNQNQKLADKVSDTFNSEGNNDVMNELTASNNFNNNQDDEEMSMNSTCALLCSAAFIDENLIRLLASQTSSSSSLVGDLLLPYNESSLSSRKEKSIKFRRQRRQIKLKLHGDEFLNRREGQKNQNRQAAALNRKRDLNGKFQNGPRKARARPHNNLVAPTTKDSCLIAQ